MKNGLKKSAVRLTKNHLNELIFAINTTTSSEGTGSPADRFFGRSVRSRLPNSFDPEVRSNELIEKRIKKHDARITNKNKRNKIIYQVGQRVRLQNSRLGLKGDSGQGENCRRWACGFLFCTNG